MKASLKALAGQTEPAPSDPSAPPPAKNASYRTAQTRAGTRQVSGHFQAEVLQTLRLIAVEQDREMQEILSEALNMVFERYGKPTRIDVMPGRRKRSGNEAA